jgi:branched-chain amino acid transport system permease protein
MTWTLLLQSAIAGITNGFIYGLTGLGIAVIFRGTRVINAMQGDFSLIAGVVAYLILSSYGPPLPLALLGGIAAGGAIGILVERLLIRPIDRLGGTEDRYLLVTLGGAFAVSGTVLLLFGHDTRSMPGIGGDRSVDIFDATLSVHAIWLITISIAIVLFLYHFFAQTHLGRSMMAAAIDPEGAATIGIDVPLMRTLTFLMGGLIGGLAGVLIAPLVTLHYEIGLLLTLKGFAAAILGGLTKPFGAIVGGLILGLLESFAVLMVSSGYKDVVAMAMLIAIMILLPGGLFSRRTRQGG